MMVRSFGTSAGVLTGALLMIGAGPGASVAQSIPPVAPVPLIAAPGFGEAPSFFRVDLPDTQNYTEPANESAGFPAIFRAQAQWVADNAGGFNIRAVTHYGDIVQDGDGNSSNDRNRDEWDQAWWSMQPIFEAGVAVGLAPGNHDVFDYDTGGLNGPDDYSIERYLEYFGPQIFQNVTLDDGGYYGGASPTGRSSYQIFRAGGREWIMVHLTVGGPYAELEWAQQVLIEHRDKPANITIHRYIQDVEDYVPDGLEFITDLVVESGRYPDIWFTFEIPSDPVGNNTQDIYEQFVRTNPNIFMVVCGHFDEEWDNLPAIQANNGREFNHFGLPVYQILADYQLQDNGGDGWLRLYEFDVPNEVIRATTYSPWREAQGQDPFQVDRESLFDIELTSTNVRGAAPARPVTFDEYELPGLYTFQWGVVPHASADLPYIGTVDTWFNENDRGRSYGSSGTLEVDNDVRNNPFNDREGHAAIRFDNIFGNTPGQIPADAEIIDAKLRVVFDAAGSADIDDPRDEDVRVFRATRSWSESDTWDSLGSGLRDDLGELIGEFNGDNDPEGNEARVLGVMEVTDLVKAWQDGSQPNHGFVLMPENLGFLDDGVVIRSSENGAVIARPALDIRIALPDPVACSPADLARDLGVLNRFDFDRFRYDFQFGGDFANYNGTDNTDAFDSADFADDFARGCAISL